MPSDQSTATSVPHPASPELNYDLFMSYSRTDTVFAAALEKMLESYKPPKTDTIPQRRLRVFRDQEDLIGADYYQSIDKYINSCAKMLLICSPAAAKSKYVNDEVKRFLAKHPQDDIIPVLLNGIPNNEAKPDEAALCAFPPGPM